MNFFVVDCSPGTKSQWTKIGEGEKEDSIALLYLDIIDANVWQKNCSK